MVPQPQTCRNTNPRVSNHEFDSSLIDSGLNETPSVRLCVSEHVVHDLIQRPLNRSQGIWSHAPTTSHESEHFIEEGVGLGL